MILLVLVLVLLLVMVGYRPAAPWWEVPATMLACSPVIRRSVAVLPVRRGRLRRVVPAAATAVRRRDRRRAVLPAHADAARVAGRFEHGRRVPGVRLRDRDRCRRRPQRRGRTPDLVLAAGAGAGARPVVSPVARGAGDGEPRPGHQVRVGEGRRVLRLVGCC